MSLLDDVDFNAHVAATAIKFNIPGISIALVDLKRGEISSKGFDNQTSETVTGDTVFAIYSNTKLFTTVAYGILVEEGKCAWNSKLCDLLPDLHLQDDHAQYTLTVEDILSHQSGLSGHDLVETSAIRSLSNVVQSISGLRFNKPARSAYQYCNITYQLVGHIIAALSSMSFADFVESRILKPLDMVHTTWTAPKDGDVSAQGYFTIWNDKVQPRERIPLPCIGLARENVSAASGSMLSTASDMAKWLAFLLRLSRSEASEDDLKIIKPETMREILRSRVIANEQIGPLPVDVGQALWAEMSVPTYALAQLRGHYRGTDIASHNGNGLGGGIILLWTPGKDFGICILTNTVGGAFHAGISIALTALDMHLGRSTLDWNDRLSLQTMAQANRLPSAPEASQTPCTWPISKLCGSYVAPFYGKLEIVDPALANTSHDLDERFGNFMEIYQNAKPFGKVWDRKPAMLAICEENMFCDAYELYYIRSGRFFGVPIRMIDQTENGELIYKAPIWTSFGGDFCAGFEFAEDSAENRGVQLEYYAEWMEEDQQTTIGSGTATFAKMK